MLRRRFLALGIFGGLAAPFGYRRALSPQTAAAAAPRPAFVTYVGFAAAPGSTFTDATRLTRGDPSLAPGIDLRFAGASYPPATVTQPAKSIAVDTLFAPFHANTFRPWWASRGPARQSAAPSCIAVPVDASVGVQLSVSVDESTVGASTSSVRLTVGSERGVPRLQAGHYALALVPVGRRPPTWSTVALIEDAAGGLSARGPAGSPPCTMVLCSVARG